MNRLPCLAVIWLLASALPGADPSRNAPEDYRITFANAAGKISLPDEAQRKVWFINLDAVNKEPHQKFGGPKGERFMAWLYVKKSAPNPRTGLVRDASELVCVEVATSRQITLVMGEEMNLASMTQPKK